MGDAESGDGPQEREAGALHEALHARAGAVKVLLAADDIGVLLDCKRCSSNILNSN